MPWRAQATRRRRGADHISSLFVLLSSTALSAFWGIEAGKIVGPDPAWRSDRKGVLCPGGKLARGLEVAADVGRLRGREVRMRQAVLQAVGHRKMAVNVARVLFAHH